MEGTSPRAVKIVADFTGYSIPIVRENLLTWRPCGHAYQKKDVDLTFIKNYVIIKGEGYKPSQQTKQYLSAARLGQLYSHLIPPETAGRKF